MTEKSETLKRQQDTQNPVLQILEGTVAHLDALCDLMDEFNRDEDGEVLSRAVAEVVAEKRDWIDKMAESKLFTSLVLKVQRPVAANHSDPVLLVYNEDRSLEDHLVFDDPTLYELFGDDFRMFVAARLWASGTLQILRRVEEQGW